MTQIKFLSSLLILLFVFSIFTVSAEHEVSAGEMPTMPEHTVNNSAIKYSDNLQPTYKISTEREILRFSSFEQRDKVAQELLTQGVQIYYVFQAIPALTVQITNTVLPSGVERIPSIENIQQFSQSQVVYNNPLKDHVSTSVTITEESSKWIGVDYLWNLGLFGEGMELGIIDSGINSSLLAFEDVDDPTVDRITRVVVSELASEGNQDLSGHGTHVAGIAAGNGYYKINGKYALYNSHGMAPKAKIYSVKVLNKYGSGADTGVIEGIDLAIARNVSVISMSLGSTDFQFPTSEGFFGDLVAAATKKDILIVAAAGNSGLDGSSTVSLPAAFPDVLAVGAVGHELVNLQDKFYPWTFTATGPAIPPDIVPKPDVLAPGVNVISVKSTDGTPNSLSGTSMSVPHVSGGALLLREAFPNATAQEIKAAIMASATDLGYPVEVQGRGLVNFKKAYEILQNGLVTSAITANPLAIHDGNEVNANNQFVRRQNLYYFNRIAGTTTPFNLSLNSPITTTVTPMVKYYTPNLNIELPAELNLTAGMNIFNVNISISSAIIQQNHAVIYFMQNNTVLPYANITYHSQTIPSRGTILFDRSKDRDTEVSYYYNDGPIGKYSKLAQVLANSGYTVKQNFAQLTSAILDSVDALVISDPDLPYSGDEIKLIRQFVDDDGKGLFILGNGGLEHTDTEPFSVFSRDSLNTILSLSTREDTGVQFVGEGAYMYNTTNKGFSVYTRRDQSIIEKNVGIDYFGPGLSIEGTNTHILASDRGIPLAASSEVGNGRIVIFGSTLTFDNKALINGRYKGSDAEATRKIALEIFDWITAPRRIQTSYLIKGIEYSGQVQARINIREDVLIEFAHPRLPLGGQVTLPPQITAYLVHKDNPLLTLVFNMTYDATRDTYSQILNIQIWGEYYLYTPVQINGYTPSDGRLDLFVDLPLYSDQKSLKLLARVLLVSIFVTWILWLKNERKKNI